MRRSNFVFIACIAVVSILVSANVSPAQDSGVRDTVKLLASQDWYISSPSDSSFSVDLWAWCDDSEVLGASLPFRLSMSGPGYTPAIHDSFIVIDTFIKDPGWNPVVFAFRRSVIWNEVNYPPHITDTTFGWIGSIVGGVNFFVPPLFNLSTHTRMGEFSLKIRHANRLPDSFEIAIDSFFYPPAGTFKFSPSGGTGFAPELLSATVNVVNMFGAIACGDVNGSGMVDIDDVIYLINYVYLGGPPPIEPAVGDTNCDSKTDLLDIVVLVNYIFRGGPQPCAECP